MQHLRGGSSPPSDTTHFPIFFAFRGECLRADGDVGSEFVLSGQVGDLEPELFVDGCLHLWLGVLDDVAQVAEAGDEVADVVFDELAGVLAVAGWRRGRARQRARPGGSTWRRPVR